MTTVTAADRIEALAQCDLVFVCTPPRVVAPTVVALLATPGSRCVVVDTASTKERILQEVLAATPEAGRYIGGHPLAGGNSGGPFDADAATLRQARFVLDAREGVVPGALDLARGFIQALGMEVLLVDARKHDEILALSSHLPHLIAYAYVASLRDLSAADRTLFAALASKSTRSLANFASENAQMWSDIFDESAELSARVDGFSQSLAQLSSLGNDGKTQQLRAALKDIAALADNMDLRLK
jgi:prephenate dehydrogenase